jgi:DNA mismatch repair protein MutL
LGLIAVLPPEVADQIAAGEVVERPASVVKELVENSLDADATMIEVAVEEGGHRLIRVSDDGSGMDPEDASLALVRHGTSKIRTSADLVGVASYGFRGEALPAIASISQFEMETSPADSAGVSLSVSGGSVTPARDVSRRRGTTVSVAKLFYNVPARRKFLRSARSEWRAITESFIAIALTRPKVRFILTHDGRQALALPPVSSLRARLAGVWGGRYAGGLLDVDDVSGPIHIAGLAERPADVGTATRRVFISVNGRSVRDAGIVRAAEAAYRSTISAGLRPSLFLSVTLPADSVDVNVHPAKAEIRFRDRWQAERAVEAAVRRALGTFDSAAAIGDRHFGTAPFFTGSPVVTADREREVLQSQDARDGALFEGNESEGAATDTDAVTVVVNEEIPPLFQFRRTYIAFEHADGLVLIDQHSAHERILYEQFIGMLEGGNAPAQRLLFPLTLHLGPAEGDALEANREYLERLGFEIEGFGGHTLLVSSVPTPHPRFDAERCLRETLDALTGDRVAGTATRHEHLAATVACKAAIKAGEELSDREMGSLFAALRDTHLPAHDVHGRSTIVQLTWDELDRRFGRR